MIRRLVVGLLLAGVASAGIIFGSMSHAAAAPLCATPPEPFAPREGLSGMLTLPPKVMPPASADPFADPRIAIHDVYGTSWKLSLYDLGCIPDPTGGDAIARFDNANASLVMDLAATNIAFLSLLERLTKESGIDWLSAWIGSMSEAITPIIFGGMTEHGLAVGLLPAAILITAVWIAWVARKGELSTIWQQVGVLLVSFILAAYALAAPVYASTMADKAVTTVAAAGGSAFNASLTDGVNRNAMYRAWLAIHFGDADSAAAKEYGPRLVKASHWTWHEWRDVENNPERLKELTKVKQDDYKKIASEVKEKYPGRTYESFAGSPDRSRSTPAFGAAGASVPMSFFSVMAFVIILVSRLMMQALVIIAPIGAILGVLPNGERSLRDMASLFGASLWNVFKFSLAAGLMAMLMGRLMTLDPVSAVVWMIIATVLFFVVLKPFRSFKTMVPGLDPNKSYIKAAGKFVSQIAIATATGGASGAAAGAAVAGKAATAATAPAAAQKVDLRTPPPLPAPVFQQVPGTNRKVALSTPGSSSGPAAQRQLVGPGGGWGGIAPTTPLPPAPDKPQREVTTLRMEKPIIVTPGQTHAAAAGQLDQSKVLISGEVVAAPGTYVPSRQSRIESLAAPRTPRESRQVELYRPGRTA